MAIRILIADESPTVRVSLAELLRQEGYETVVASTEDEVFAAYAAQIPGILLVNLNMPGISPPDIGHLKKINPSAPILVLTSDTRFQTVVEAMRSGADDVLTHPSTPERLLAAVERAEQQVAKARQLDEDEAEIKRLTTLNQQIIDYSPVPIAVLDLKGVVSHINNAMLRLLDCPQKTCIGEHLISLLERSADEIDGEFRTHLSRVLEHRSPVHGSALHARLSGVDRYFDVDLIPLRETDDGAGVMVVLHDVSQWIIGHQFLRSVVRDSADAIVIADEQLVIRLWSVGAEKIFGYALKEIIGKPLTLLFPPGQTDTDPASLLAHLAESPSSEKKRTHRRRQDGALVDVELTQFALTDPQGHPVGICEVSRDITLDVAREREIEGIKDFYEHIVDTISDGIRVIQVKERRIVLANKAHLEWIGMSAGEVIGRHSQEVPWGLDEKNRGVQMEALVDRALATGLPERQVYASRPAKSDRVHWMDIVAYPMANALETIEHVVLVGRDITARVEMEANLAAERDRRDQVFTSAPIGILTTDTQGSIQFANPMIAQIFGVFSPDALIGENLFHLDQVKNMELTARFRQVLSHGTPLHQDQITCASPLGRDTIINIRAEPLFDQTRTITGLVAVIENVTEKISLQRRLSATTADLTMLAEIGELFQESRDPDLILQTILVGVTAGEGLGFNRAFWLAADSETHALRGKYAIGPSDAQEAWRIWSELKTTPHTLHDVLSGYRAAMARGEVRINEVARDLVISLEDAENIAARAAIERRAFLVTDGRHHPMVPRELADRLGTDSFAVVPLIFKDSVEGVIIADNAITGKKITDFDLRSLELFAHQATLAVERSRLYFELEHRLHEVQEAHSLLKENQEVMLKNARLAAMGQLAAQVAHEIRNPLVAIGGFARNVLRGLEEYDSKHEFVQIIVDETSRLEKILGDVLEFSRPKNGRMAAMDLVHLVRRTVGMMQGELSDHRIETRLELPSEEVRVRADADQIRQVLQNLIHNAVEAMSADDDAGAGGGPQGTLTVTLQVAHGKAVVQIEDTGCGLDQETMRRMFEPFFTTKSHGTGLGLAICQQIVRDHGGEIAVANNPDRGAVFSVVLPCLQKEETDGTDSRY